MVQTDHCYKRHDYDYDYDDDDDYDYGKDWCSILVLLVVMAWRSIAWYILVLLLPVWLN